MDKKSFNELLKNVREARAIIRGEKKPARVTRLGPETPRAISGVKRKNIMDGRAGSPLPAARRKCHIGSAGNAHRLSPDGGQGTARPTSSRRRQ